MKSSFLVTFLLHCPDLDDKTCDPDFLLETENRISSSMVEQLTLNQLVEGSSPSWSTSLNAGCRGDCLLFTVSQTVLVKSPKAVNPFN